MRIRVNGEEQEVPAGTSVAGLIEDRGLRPEACAVERNRELVPRTGQAETLLADGDEIEVVTLVGGG